jgi:hypothetical protein
LKKRKAIFPTELRTFSEPGLSWGITDRGGGIDVIKTENLNAFDAELGFALGQCQ